MFFWSFILSIHPNQRPLGLEWEVLKNELFNEFKMFLLLTKAGKKFLFIYVVNEQNTDLKQLGQEIEAAPPGFWKWEVLSEVSLHRILLLVFVFSKKKMVPPPTLAFRPSYIEKMVELNNIRVRKQQLINILGQHQPPPQPPPPPQQQ